MKKILGLLAAGIFLTACGATPQNSATKTAILQKMKTDATDDAAFSDFLKNRGDDLRKNNFEPEKIGIKMPTDAELSKSFYDEIIVELSKIGEKSADQKTLNFLGNHKNAGVRSAVAKNPAISGDLQKRFSTDESFLVRAYLAANRKIKTETAKTLSTDENASVRRPLAQNPAVAADLLKIFVADKNPTVQISLARNPKLPVEIMTKMIEKSGKPALLELLKRDDFPEDLREKMKKDRPEIFQSATENLSEKISP